MDKHLGLEFENLKERELFLKDNCDACETKGYMKPYTPEELQGHKEKLANVSIDIASIEAEMKLVVQEFKGRLKPLIEARNQMVGNIKSKAEYVSEICYKFVDQEERLTGYYNSEGVLIECRPSTADELQPNIFHTLRTGTNN